jgi:hypothetical protein
MKTFESISFYLRCAVVNFCVSSGVSVIAVFVSFLCAILASAFYKYNISREQMSAADTSCNPTIDQDDNDLNETVILAPTTTEESSIPTLLPDITIDETDKTTTIESLTEIEISVDEDTNTNENEDENANEENHHEVSNEILMETIEGTEEEIQKQQIANIFRLLNDQHLINNWSTTDFLDQLKMYGLHTYDEDEQEPEPEPEPS